MSVATLSIRQSLTMTLVVLGILLFGVAGYQRLYPNGHPSTAWALHLLANITMETGRFAESESLHVQAHHEARFGGKQQPLGRERPHRRPGGIQVQGSHRGQRPQSDHDNGDEDDQTAS